MHRAKQATVAKHEGESYRKASRISSNQQARTLHPQVTSRFPNSLQQKILHTKTLILQWEWRRVKTTSSQRRSRVVSVIILGRTIPNPEDSQIEQTKGIHSFVVGFNQLERNECTQHRLWRCFGPREARSGADTRDGMTMAEGDGQRSRIRAGHEEPWWEGRGSTIAKKFAKLRLLIWPEGGPVPSPSSPLTSATFSHVGTPRWHSRATSAFYLFL